MRIRPIATFMIAFATLLPICGMTTQSNQKGSAKTVPLGIWGGDHIRMRVDSHGAEIEFNCARGEITEPLAVDENGHFQVKGSFKSETPAPMEDGPDSSTNAVYSGTLHDDQLRLEVSVSGVDGVQTFELVYDQPGRLTKCA